MSDTQKTIMDDLAYAEDGKFSFKVPETHPEAGKKINGTFKYPVCANDGQAEQVISYKKWNLKDMVNEILKANARASAYQAALLPYQPSEVAPEDIKERMIRDYIRLGVPEAAARAQVESMLAAK
jgi:hypothetical protein